MTVWIVYTESCIRFQAVFNIHGVFASLEAAEKVAADVRGWVVETEFVK